MLKLSLACAAVAALSIASPAAAALVVSGTGTVDTSDPTQTGRVTRDGVASTWAAPKSYPGTLNPSTSYNYDLINGTFGANALQVIYYEITVGSGGTNLFSVAYLNSFNPANPATNYLGDAGASSALETYQVIVPIGGQLFVDIQSFGTTEPYTYSISAFSDPNRGENFLTGSVPEPTTWAMMLLGFGAIGAAMRRRKAVALA
jgi:hypothetical protein